MCPFESVWIAKLVTDLKPKLALAVQSLTLAEVYRVVCALQVRPNLAWKEFRSRYNSVADLLITRLETWWISGPYFYET
jgi:hypothetical protein